MVDEWHFSPCTVFLIDVAGYCCHLQSCLDRARWICAGISYLSRITIRALFLFDLAISGRNHQPHSSPLFSRSLRVQRFYTCRQLISLPVRYYSRATTHACLKPYEFLAPYDLLIMLYEVSSAPHCSNCRSWDCCRPMMWNGRGLCSICV
jgi:hypothetical protein